MKRNKESIEGRPTRGDERTIQFRSHAIGKEVNIVEPQDKIRLADFSHAPSTADSPYRCSNLIQRVVHFYQHQWRIRLAEGDNDIVARITSRSS